MRIKICLLFLAIIGGFGGVIASDNNGNGSSTRMLHKLYRILNNSTQENFLVSPISFTIANAMSKVVKEEEEESETNNPGTGAIYNDGFLPVPTQFRRDLRANVSFGLVNTNKVFPAEDAKLDNVVLNTLKTLFGVQCEPIDYSDPEQAASIINSFVSNSTQEQVTEVLTPDELSNTTKVVGVSALYLHGLWEKRFLSEDTVSNFYTFDGYTVPVEMMRLRAPLQFGYIPELESHCVALPYQESRLTVYIFLPTERYGHLELERKLADFSLQQVIPFLKETEVDLSFPKFQVESVSGYDEGAETPKENPLNYYYQFRFRFNWFVTGEGGYYAGATAYTKATEGRISRQFGKVKRMLVDHPFHAIVTTFNHQEQTQPGQNRSIPLPLLIARIGNPFILKEN